MHLVIKQTIQVGDRKLEQTNAINAKRQNN